MDCFRSGRDVPAGAPPNPVVLAGREGGAGSEPRKSSPKSELLFAGVAFGGAGAALGGTFVAMGPAVLARGMGSSPPMRSKAAAACGCGVGEAEGPPDRRRDSLRSMFCFSLTRLSGTSSSPSASRDAGSGMGPSMTHLLSSYFVRIKFSILASEGVCPGASLSSQYLFARAFPQLRMLCICSSVQESRSTDLTLLM